MAFFSNHYNTSGTVVNGIGAFAEELPIATPPAVVSAGIKHSRVRRSHAKVSLGSAFAAAEIGRMFTLKSGDMLYSLLFSSDGGSTVGDADVGIYLSGANHDGDLPTAAAVDAFSNTPEATDTEHDRVEIFEGGASIDTENIGLPVWELINLISAATYDEDPHVDFDICLTIVNAATDAISIVQLEAFYTSGA